MQSRCGYGSDGKERCPTSYPDPNYLGASFNKSVWLGRSRPPRYRCHLGRIFLTISLPFGPHSSHDYRCHLGRIFSRGLRCWFSFIRALLAGMGKTIGVELRSLWLQGIGENHVSPRPPDQIIHFKIEFELT